MALLLTPFFGEKSLWRDCFAKEMPELELRFWPEPGHLADIDVVAITRLPDNVLRSLPKLRLIVSLFAGQNLLLADKTIPPDVPIVRAANPDGDRMMTETTVLHVMRHHRDLPGLALAQLRAEWVQPVRKATGERHVGVMGLGPIGLAAATALAALGFQVSAWARRPRRLDGIAVFAGMDQLDAFLARSEILVNLLPLTAETEDIIDKTLLARLPKGACVINLGRGQHVVDADLIAALDAGRIGSATLDVFRQEPLPPNDPLWRHPGITILPHAARGQFPSEIVPLICAHVRRLERGENLTDLVDRAAGY